MDQHEIISRKEAQAAGLQHYFTGVPCRRGLVALRLTSNWRCLCALCSEAKRSAFSVWTDENREAERARLKAHAKQNPERVRESSAAWKAANPAAAHAMWQRRRARKLNATPAWDAELTDLVATEAADLCVKREAATGFPWEVDHMIPLQARKASGLHTAANLQVIPFVMNRAKGNKMQLTEPREWLRHG